MGKLGIKMTRTHQASEDGINVKLFEEGNTYAVDSELARRLVNKGYAEPVKKFNDPNSDTGDFEVSEDDDPQADTDAQNAPSDANRPVAPNDLNLSASGDLSGNETQVNQAATMEAFTPARAVEEATPVVEGEDDSEEAEEDDNDDEQANKSQGDDSKRRTARKRS